MAIFLISTLMIIRMESDSYYLGLALAQAKKGLVAGEVLARPFNRPMPLSSPSVYTEIFLQVLVAGVRRTGNIIKL